MKPGNSSFLVQIYHTLLRLYPAEFRAEFSLEMEDVFSEAIAEAQKKGSAPVLILLLRELRDLPSSLWRERRRRRQNHRQIVALANDIEGTRLWRPATGLEAAVTVLPFVLSGLMYTYKALGYAGFTRGLMSDYYLRLYLVALAGFGIGWVKGFPRWSLGYVGLALILSWGGIGMPVLATSRLEIYSTTFVLNDFWGWRSLLAVGLYATLFCRSLYPLIGLARDIWRDWSRLSFIWYGALSYLSLGMIYDNKSWYDQVAYLPADVFTAALIFVIGVLVYLRMRSPMQRGLALQGALNLALLAPMVIGAGAVDVDMDGSADVAWPILAAWFVFLLLPGILGIMRRASRSPGIA